jgi:hypothetical protein
MDVKPKKEVNASADRFLRRERGRRMKAVIMRMFEVRPLSLAGKPAEACEGGQ